jgi:hypothetical protein
MVYEQLFISPLKSLTSAARVRKLQSSKACQKVFGKDHSRLDPRRASKSRSAAPPAVILWRVPPRRYPFATSSRRSKDPIAVNACLDHELGCDQMPRCTMIGVWSEVQRNITEVLSRTTIAALQRTPCHELISSSSLSSAA